MGSRNLHCLHLQEGWDVSLNNGSVNDNTLFLSTYNAVIYTAVIYTRMDGSVNYSIKEGMSLPSFTLRCPYRRSPS